MTKKDADKILKDLTYKSGWKWRSFSDPLGWQFICEMFTLDVRDPTKKVMLMNQLLLPWEIFYHMDEERFIQEIFDFIERMEEHESREWFRINGKQVYKVH